jgi:hypothetical protein
MQSAKKVTLIPANNIYGKQSGERDKLNESSVKVATPRKSAIKKSSSKVNNIYNFIKVILKLAQKYGYDDDLRIKLKNGKYMENTNVVTLLEHAMSDGEVLYGESEFIELLHSSGVSPDLIINKNVRNKLIILKNSQDFIEQEPQSEGAENDENIDRRVENRKRKSDNLDLEQAITSKRFRNSEEQEQSEAPPRASTLRNNQSLKRRNEENQVNRSVRSRYEDIDDDKIDPRIWEIPSDSDSD